VVLVDTLAKTMTLTLVNYMLWRSLNARLWFAQDLNGVLRGYLRGLRSGFNVSLRSHEELSWFS